MMRLWGASALVFLAGMAAATAQPAPDLILHNARIHTVDAGNRTAQALAVAGGRIVALGTNEEVLRLAGAATRRIDAGGRTVLPGLIDAHIHVLPMGQNLKKLRTNDLKDLATLLARVKAMAAALPKEAWIEGASDWHESQLRENRFPTRWELDAAAPAHPVFLRRGGHNVVINSVAMRLAGIGERDPDPPGGHYERDAQGRFNGWILERPAIEKVADLIPKPAPDEDERAAKAAMRALNASGITAVRDMHVLPPDARTWHALAAKGETTVRAHLMLSIHPRRPAAEDIATVEGLRRQLGAGDDFVRIGGIKMTHDGGVEANLTSEEYANKKGYKGATVTPVAKMKEMSAWACRNGWTVGIHTVGDQAIRNVLGLWQELAATCPIAGKRWGLEHPYLLSPETIAQMKALGVIPHMQTPHHYTLGVGWVAYWGRSRADRSIPNRTLIDAGFEPTGGTDAPVTPYDAFLGMWSDVTRQTAAAGIIGKAEAVTAAESLRMRTIWAARGMHWDGAIGSLEVGKFADFVVVSADPLTVEPNALRDIVAELTFLGGRLVYERK